MFSCNVQPVLEKFVCHEICFMISTSLLLSTSVATLLSSFGSLLNNSVAVYPERSEGSNSVHTVILFAQAPSSFSFPVGKGAALQIFNKLINYHIGFIFFNHHLSSTPILFKNFK